MNISTSKVSPWLLRLVEMLAKIRGPLNIHVPEAYQDANGFHFGRPTVQKQLVWPPGD